MISDNMRGALLMMAGMAAFTINDTAMKAVFADLPLFQALFLRGLGTTLVFVVVGLRTGLFRLRLGPTDRRLVLLRTACEVGAAYFFLTALAVLPLANITAILQTLPLTLTLAAALVFGEPLGWRRLAAIGIGFFGVLLIVRPGTDGFTVYSVMAIVSVLFVTVRDLATRRISAQVPSVLVALATAAGVTLFALLASATEDWVMPDGGAALLLLTSISAIVAGYMMSVMAVRVGDLGFVSPFRYTGLLWALVLGYLVFDEFPTTLTLLGSAIIVATGVFTLHRERMRSRAVAARAGQPPA